MQNDQFKGYLDNATYTIEYPQVKIVKDSTTIDFNLNYDLGAGDTLTLSGSTNNGASWTPLYSVTAGFSVGFDNHKINISKYAGLNLIIKMELITDNIPTLNSGFRAGPISIIDYESGIYNESEFEFSFGTSGATANVSGATALLWTKYPDRTSKQISDAIKNSTTIYPTHKNNGGISLDLISSNIIASESPPPTPTPSGGCITQNKYYPNLFWTILLLLYTYKNSTKRSIYK